MPDQDAGRTFIQWTESLTGCPHIQCETGGTEPERHTIQRHLNTDTHARGKKYPKWPHTTWDSDADLSPGSDISAPFDPET
jgi:hypothetical protein